MNLDGFWNWIRGQSALPGPMGEPGNPPSAPALVLSPGSLARPEIELLAEDEALRGGLTDAGFGPVLDWVTSLVMAAAIRIAGEPEPTPRMEQVGAAARALVRAIVRAAEQGDIHPLSAALAPPLLTADQARRAQQALSPPGEAETAPDERAPLIVRRLADAVAGDRP